MADIPNLDSVLESETLRSFGQFADSFPEGVKMIGSYVLLAQVPRKPVFFVKDSSNDLVLKTSEPIHIPRVSGFTPSGLGEEIFAYECRLHTSLCHPNICPARVEVLSGKSYLVMPKIGGDLFSAFPIPEGSAVNVLGQLASALDHCHKKGVVHLDVKMENVGYDGNVWLFDFGSARRLDEKNEMFKSVDFLSCTERTAAPEFINDRYYNARTDVFSFSYVSYVLLAHNAPFRHLRDRIVYDAPRYDSASLNRFGPAGGLVIRGLSRKNKERPGMDELADAFKEQSAIYCH